MKTHRKSRSTQIRNARKLIAARGGVARQRGFGGPSAVQLPLTVVFPAVSASRSH